ncbi:ABC-type oligopeptide transport system ATPase subunit [Bacillus capparidis]|uniref:ABC-type oligopeptide transport system ATPase subunit n=1 Tax=Bacillus capparidis TaxID=1840411 RepID=A0ABS4D2A7_9BACI|nr:ABC-type oligopeptide transport system ATPase subunit [Bacillus capparidis]
MKKELLKVQHLKKYYSAKKPIFSKANQDIKALDDVSFSVYEGETLGIVGESGSGKSTLGKTILRLTEATAGEIVFSDKKLLDLKQNELRTMRRHFQMIFQDPYASLNPRMRIKDILEEPLIVHKIGTKEDRKQQVAEMLDVVGLGSGFGNRYAHQFSGGQRQRIGIARALIIRPKLIVLDEPVSALDVSVQAQILNLLADLQKKFSLTYLFISHDLSVVKYISDRVAVMNKGKIVELKDCEELYESPEHPYTKTLLAAVPVLEIAE